MKVPGKKHHYFTDYTNDKKSKHPYHKYRESSSGLDGKSNQSQHVCKPKPNSVKH